MSKFITWFGDNGWASDGTAYTLAGERGIGEPPFYVPWVMGANGFWKSVPNEFHPMGWMTKTRAKKACEAHYVASRAA